jgi:hypothetical protein
MAAAVAGQDLAAAQGAMLALVTEIVSSQLGAEVAPDQPLMEAGLDSLGESTASHLLSAFDACPLRCNAPHTWHAGTD